MLLPDGVGGPATYEEIVPTFGKESFMEIISSQIMLSDYNRCNRKEHRVIASGGKGGLRQGS